MVQPSEGLELRSVAVLLVPLWQVAATFSLSGERYAAEGQCLKIVPVPIKTVGVWGVHNRLKSY
jgi:hypothetical protein